MYYIYKELAYLAALKAANRLSRQIQSRTKLLEKVFPIMSTFLCNKTISKTTPLWEEDHFPRFNVASQKRPGIRLSFEYTTTLLSGEGGEGRTGTATIFRKMLSKYTIFSTVLSKIVAPSAPRSGSRSVFILDLHLLSNCGKKTRGRNDLLPYTLITILRALP